MKTQVTEDVRVVADLDKHSYHIPSFLAHSDLRPGIIAYSCFTKTVILIELTICSETNFEGAQLRKTEKYSDLV